MIVMGITEVAKGTQQDFEDILKEIGTVAKVKFMSYFVLR